MKNKDSIKLSLGNNNQITHREKSPIFRQELNAIEIFPGSPKAQNKPLPQRFSISNTFNSYELKFLSRGKRKGFVIVMLSLTIDLT